jgi:hypothetical protein
MSVVEKRESTGVSKEESRVIEWNDGARLPIDMILVFEEFHESVSHAFRRPLKSWHCGGGGCGTLYVSPLLPHTVNIINNRSKIIVSFLLVTWV